MSVPDPTTAPVAADASEEATPVVVTPELVSTSQLPAEHAEDTLPGGDASKGQFAWHHPDCGTIYADTQDEAIKYAYQRLMVHDPLTAASSCVNVVRSAYNPTPTDWKPDAA